MAQANKFECGNNNEVHFS